MSNFDQDLQRLETALRNDYRGHATPLYADAYKEERAFLEKYAEQIAGSNAPADQIQAQMRLLHDRIQRDIGSEFIIPATIDENGQIVFDSNSCNRKVGIEGFSNTETRYSPQKAYPELAQQVDLLEIGGNKVVSLKFADGSSKTFTYNGEMNDTRMTFAADDGQTLTYDMTSKMVTMQKDNVVYKYASDGTTSVLETNKFSEFHPDGLTSVTNFDPKELAWIATDISQSINYADGSQSCSLQISSAGLKLDLGPGWHKSIPADALTLDQKTFSQYAHERTPNSGPNSIAFKDELGNKYTILLANKTIEKIDTSGVVSVYDITQRPPVLIEQKNSS